MSNLAPSHAPAVAYGGNSWYWETAKTYPSITDRFTRFFKDMKDLGVVGWTGRYSNVDSKWNRGTYHDHSEDSEDENDHFRGEDLMNPGENFEDSEFPFKNYVFTREPSVTGRTQYVYVSHNFDDEDIKAKVLDYVKTHTEMCLWDGTFASTIVVYGGDYEDLPEHVREWYDKELYAKNKKRREEQAEQYRKARAEWEAKEASKKDRLAAGRIKAQQTREANKVKKAAVAAARAAARAAKVSVKASAKPKAAKKA